MSPAYAVAQGIGIARIIVGLYRTYVRYNEWLMVRYAELHSHTNMSFLDGASHPAEMVVLAAGRKFEVVARIDVGEKAYATPAVANGVMYLRTQSRLYSLGKTR